MRLIVLGVAASGPLLYGAVRLASAVTGRKLGALALFGGLIVGAAVGWRTRGLVSAHLGVVERWSISDASNRALAATTIALILLSHAPLPLLEAGMGTLSGIAGIHATRALARWWPYRYLVH